jgi:acyl carrier protein
VKDRIRRITAEYIKSSNSEIDDTQNLYTAGLKSLAAVRFMLALEREFDVEFPSSALTDGSLTTIDHIYALITLLEGDSLQYRTA